MTLAPVEIPWAFYSRRGLVRFGAQDAASRTSSGALRALQQSRAVARAGSFDRAVRLTAICLKPGANHAKAPLYRTCLVITYFEPATSNSTSANDGLVVVCRSQCAHAHAGDLDDRGWLVRRGRPTKGAPSRFITWHYCTPLPFLEWIVPFFTCYVTPIRHASVKTRSRSPRSGQGP